MTAQMLTSSLPEVLVFDFTGNTVISDRIINENGSIIDKEKNQMKISRTEKNAAVFYYFYYV